MAAAAAAFIALYRFTDISSFAVGCGCLPRASEILSFAFAVYLACRCRAQGIARSPHATHHDIETCSAANDSRMGYKAMILYIVYATPAYVACKSICSSGCLMQCVLGYPYLCKPLSLCSRDTVAIAISIHGCASGSILILHSRHGNQASRSLIDVGANQRHIFCTESIRQSFASESWETLHCCSLASILNAPALTLWGCRMRLHSSLWLQLACCGWL